MDVGKESKTRPVHQYEGNYVNEEEISEAYDRTKRAL